MRPKVYVTTNFKLMDSMELPPKYIPGETEDLEVNFHGWDIRQFLRLLQKSNPAIIDAFSSPIYYCISPDIMNPIERLLRQQVLVKRLVQFKIQGL
eukprot:gene6755-2615_t